MVKTQKILTEPAPGTQIAPVRTYTEVQEAQIKDLRKHADTLLLPKEDPYYVWELRWLNMPDTMPRYMRAAKWNFDDAKKRLQGTMQWRREFKPDLIPLDEVKSEAATGKIILNGFDKDGRPIIYMRPGRENSSDVSRQLQHLVWWLERAKDLMPPGQDTLVIFVDYKSTTMRTNPSLSTARKVLTILQSHYVETLGRAMVVNLPTILNFFYKGISPFLDPVTRDKLRFNPDLFELVPKEQLDAEFGGDYEFEFDADSYWDQIVKHCGIAPDGTRVEKPDSQAQVPPKEESTEPSSAPSVEQTEAAKLFQTSEPASSDKIGVLASVASVQPVAGDKVAVAA